MRAPHAVAIGAVAWLYSDIAHAHPGDYAIAPTDVWHHWSFDPLVLAPLFLAHWAYGRGVFRAWRRAGLFRIVPRWRVACFLAGEVALIVALVSPLDPLGDTLLSAHMLQHLVLTTLAPALLVLGAPGLAWLWAMPTSWRGLARTSSWRTLLRVDHALSRPLTATVVHGATMWLWHAPPLFEAALANEAWHVVEHASFFVSALYFWRAMLQPRKSAAPRAVGALATFMHSGLLGAVLSLASMPLYPIYGDKPMLWGLSPIADQQIAGLLMWAPGGVFYFAAFLAALTSFFPGAASQGAMRVSTSSPSMK